VASGLATFWNKAWQHLCCWHADRLPPLPRLARAQTRVYRFWQNARTFYRALQHAFYLVGAHTYAATYTTPPPTHAPPVRRLPSLPYAFISLVKTLFITGTGRT